MAKPIFPQKQITSHSQLSWIIYSKLTPVCYTREEHGSTFQKQLCGFGEAEVPRLLFSGILSQALRIPLHDSILGPCSDNPGFDREVTSSIPTVTLRLAKHNLPKLHRALPRRKLTMPRHAVLSSKCHFHARGLRDPTALGSSAHLSVS